MSTFLGSFERRSLVAPAAVLLSLLAFGVTVGEGSSAKLLAPLVLAVAVAAVAASRLLQWRTLLGLIVLVILFIPIRRYSMPGGLPFSLEPYRILVALVALVWLTSLLIDSRVRLRRTGLEGPLALFVVGALLSELFNPSRAGALTTEVVKKLSFFASFLIILYFIRSVIRTQVEIDFIAKLFVTAGVIVAVLTTVESRTGFNAFNHLQGVVPLLHFDGLSWSDVHRYRLRAYGSAQHAIAMGAGLVLLIPLAVYLAKRTGQARWRIAIALLLIGTLATRSRTSILMLLTLGLVYCVLQWRTMKQLWPLIIPLVLAAQLALPGTFGSIKASFFPQGGLIAQQSAGAGGYGSGRIADLGPGLHEWSQRPIFGEGFGTRITDRGVANALILDNQWLGTLLETGVVGIASWVWLFGRLIRRLGRRAKGDETPLGWLFAGLAAAVAAYAVSMFFYDAFSFIQEIFILFILMGIGSVALALAPSGEPVKVTAARRRPTRLSIAPVGAYRES